MDPNPPNNTTATDDPNFATSDPSSMGLPPVQPAVDQNPQPQPANPEMANDLGSQAVGQQATGMPIPNVTNNNQPTANNFEAPAINESVSGAVGVSANQVANNDILPPGQTPTTDQSNVGNSMPATPDVGNMGSASEAVPPAVPVPGAQPNSAQQPLATTGSSSKSSGKNFWLILGGLVGLLIILGVILVVL